MKVDIKSKEEVERVAWNAYVNKTSKNPAQLYEQALVQRPKNVPCFIIIEDNGEVVFQWLVFKVDHKFVSSLTILSEPSSQDDHLLALAMDSIRQTVNPFKVVFHSIVLSKFYNRAFLEKEGFSPILEYGSSLIDLNLTVDELFQKIHTKHRNVIRKAEKEKVVVVENTSLEGLRSYCSLAEETYGRSNAESPQYRDLSEYFAALSTSNSLRIYTAKNEEGKDQASALILLSDKMGIYWHGASASGMISGSANLLQWEIIKDLKGKQLELYDLGGISYLDDKAASISKFKTRFGGNNVSYFGGINVMSPFKNVLYNTVRRIKNQ